ncbi:MAG: ABC transporter permease [Syntrophomonadaceae bacterium]|jgi:ABC-type Na+ efflux pump permease subunit|nr:ABC transporter permease [Syntrophomonadaceae bacterium]
MRNVLLIAKREMLVKMRNRAYIFGTLAVVAAILILAFISSRADMENASTAMITESVKKQMELQAQAEEEVMALHGLNASEINAQITLRFQELWEIYETENPDSGVLVVRYWIGFGVGVLLFMSITLTGSMIAIGVAEEKSSRIVEILLSSMTSFQLMVGKIIGMAVIGLTQIVIILATGYFAARGFGLIGDVFAGVNLGSAIWIALGFFLVGYLSYATLYAAFAATVSRTEEVNAAIAPVMYILLIPYLAVVIPVFGNIAPLRFVLDYVPLFSPIGATVHYFQGGLDLLQALLSLAISLAALPLIMLLASRIYRRSILATGARQKIITILRGN